MSTASNTLADRFSISIFHFATDTTHTNLLDVARGMGGNGKVSQANGHNTIYYTTTFSLCILIGARIIGNNYISVPKLHHNYLLCYRVRRMINEANHWQYNVMFGSDDSSILSSSVFSLTPLACGMEFFVAVGNLFGLSSRFCLFDGIFRLGGVFYLVVFVFSKPVEAN